MAAPNASVQGSLRFGPFSLDLRSGDLSRNGRPIRLQEKPRSLLLALADRPNELMTRAELHERLWPGDTFVDFEDGLNAAMSKLREALNDDPQSPRFIETVRGRGYRLLGPVEYLAAAQQPAAENAESPPAPAPSQLPPEPAAPPMPAVQTRRRNGLRSWSLILACGVAAGAVGLWYWLTHGRPVLSFSPQDVVLIADFDNQTGDPRFDHALGTAFEVSLAQSRHMNVYSHLQAATALRLMALKQDERITPLIAREICQRESIPALVTPGITRAGREYRITAELVDPGSGNAVRTYSEEAYNEDQLLGALDTLATDIRRDLGESRMEIHRAHQPLPEVTTRSLAALQDYAEGADLFSHARAEDAARMYQKAIDLDPDFAMAHAALGYADYSFYLDNPTAGDAEFRRALALSAHTTDRERQWIDLRYAESEGRTDDAMALYRTYLEQYPGDWVARYGYARMLRMHGHASESVPMYQQLARMEPDDPGLYVELATAYTDLAQWQQAVQTYEKAFTLDPHMMSVNSTNRAYGFTLVQLGQSEKAVQVFSALLANPETDADGERSLAALDLYHGRYASAQEHYQLALAHSGDAFAQERIRFMLAAIAAGQGNSHEALRLLDTVASGLNAIPNRIAYSALVGQAYCRYGAVEKARKLLQSIAPLVRPGAKDEAAFVEMLRAEVEAASGNARNALTILKPPTADDASDVKIVLSESLAHIYQQMGDVGAAEAWYQQLLQNGEQPILGWEPQEYLDAAYYNLAADNLKQGNRAAAQHWLSQLLSQWKNADPKLPLLREANQLNAEMVAVAREKRSSYRRPGTPQGASQPA